MSFTNALMLILESWFTIYLFLAPRIADATILCSCKVLKTFNHYLNHEYKFTVITSYKSDACWPKASMLGFLKLILCGSLVCLFVCAP